MFAKQHEVLTMRLKSGKHHFDYQFGSGVGGV
jgi:hypothetical protein